MYRRTRSKRWPLMVGALVVLGGGAAVFSWWPELDRAATTPAIKPLAEPVAAIIMEKPQKKLATIASDELASKGSKREIEEQSNPKVTESKQPAPIESKTVALVSTPVVEKPAPPPPAPTVSLAVERPSSVPFAGAPTTLAAGDSAERVSQRIKAGLDLLAQNKPLEARQALTIALESSGNSPADADRIRTELTKLNKRLVFGPDVMPGDPLVQTYTVQAGDALSKLPRKLGLNVDYLFIQRINNIQDERRMRAGQRLKIVKGPFHAIIHKREFRMDLYMGEAGSPGGNRVYVRSFKVGLGEFDATPEGLFVVKPHSKLINPAWANPRTGEQFDSDDPKNPLGEHWIGLVGASENIRGLEGYGIHGTIEPESIGQLKSMGCVRMLADDVELIYELLIDNVSTVEVRGGE